MRVRLTLALSSVLPLLLTACPGCEELENFDPAGEINPPVLDLGPVSEGTECEAVFLLTNNGGSELDISTAQLEDVDGEYELFTVPNSVGIGGEENAVIKYVSSGPLGERQTAVLALDTNDPDDDGRITATVTALPVASAGGVATAYCVPFGADEGAEAEVCTTLEFGGVNVADPTFPIDQRTGLTLQLEIRNEGTAPLTVSNVLQNNGNPDFTVAGFRRGNTLVQLPQELDAGRQECGAEIGDVDNVLLVDVFYSPTAIGADTETLLVLTDAVENPNLEVPITGLGTDIGLLLTPPTVAFGEVGEGDTATVDVLVSNLGTSDASVTDTCLVTSEDETCNTDNACTGGSPILDGTLNCDVKKADGETNEGKGYVLAPTDAQAGGDDERVVILTWSPEAGAAAIPAGTMLRIETTILDNVTYTARVIGGTAGNLGVAAGDDACGNAVCVPTEGDPEDVGTWTGTAVLTLSNTGEATIDITGIAWEGPPTIADDYTLVDSEDNTIDLENPGITLGPDDTVDVRINYANDDASGQDLINLVFTHTGLDLTTTVPVQVTPPPGM